MLDAKQFTFAISQIAEEKNIPEEKIIEVIESAIAAAYKKDYGEKSQIIKSKFNKDTGVFSIFQYKTVVSVDDEGYIILKDGQSADSLSQDQEELGEDIKKIRFNPDRHISLQDAQSIQSDIVEGEEIVEELEPREDFGRIAAQTAKQVLMQKIREIERTTAFEVYKDRVGEIVVGTVQRIDRGIIFVDLGKGVGLLFPSEQVYADNYRIGSRYKFLIQSVETTDREPNIVLSRRSTDFVKTLFALEVPEIFGGSVEIVAISRDAGVRTKLAVKANGEGIDPVGACVGQRGTRVQSVINELGGEKIDIIEYSNNIEDFIKSAIAPAQVESINIDEPNKQATVIVPQDQLSLAIGGSGQNVRLASRLTGYDINLNPETKSNTETSDISSVTNEIDSTGESISEN
ncbi:MAG: transcription elongation factor NusA, utilization substance protein [Candidatus Parcubacteria bacterium]|jgi:N utilization substance protein A